jgi:hypothetical membrane protein
LSPTALTEQFHIRLPAARLFVYQFALIAGIASPILFVIADAMGVILVPGYNPLSQSISDLGLSPLGWLQDAAFFIFGVTTISLASELHSEIRGSREASVGLTMMICLGAGFILLGLFATDPLGTNHSLHGFIHHYAAWAEGGLFPVTCFFFADLFKPNRRWNILRRYSLVAGISGLALVIIWAIFENNWFGLFERLIILNGLIWFEVLAIHLRHISKSPYDISRHF